MKKNCSTTTNDPQFLLLGDSHAGAIGRAAKETGVQFVGGPMGAGREFTAPFVDWDAEKLTFRSSYADEMYQSFLEELNASSLLEVKLPLLCTFGFAPHFYATSENWEIYREADHTLSPSFLESQLFHDLICVMAQGALGFYRSLIEKGVEITAVLPPQKIPETADPNVFYAAQEVLIVEANCMGLKILDVRQGTVGKDGLQLDDYSQENDPIHGNVAFGQVLLDAFTSQRTTDHVTA